MGQTLAKLPFVGLGKRKREEEEDDVFETRSFEEQDLPLPKDLLKEVAKRLHESELFALACTCKGLKRLIDDLLIELKGVGGYQTSCFELIDAKVKVTPAWIRWAWTKHDYDTVALLEQEQNRSRAGDRDHDTEGQELCEVKGISVSGFGNGEVRLQDVRVQVHLEANLDSLNDEDQPQQPWDEALERKKREERNRCRETCRRKALTCLAAANGYKDVLKWLKRKGCPWHEKEIKRTSFAELLIGRRECDHPWHQCVPRYAAKGGQIELLRWWKFEEKLPWESELENGTLCNIAVRERNVELLSWLMTEAECVWDSNTCNYAATHGSLPVFKLLWEEGAEWSSQVSLHAAKMGHIDILRYIVEQELDGVVYEDTCAAAAVGGHLDVLKWLRSPECKVYDYVDLNYSHCRWDEETCLAAAQGGHLEVLKWARSQGCPWHSDRMCTDAAMSGNLEMLEWLVSEGQCPFDPMEVFAVTMDRMRDSIKHVDVLSWLMTKYPRALPEQFWDFLFSSVLSESTQQRFFEENPELRSLRHQDDGS